AADLARLSAELPDCDWLICGSKLFQADAERLLRQHGIAPRCVHIESFHAFSDAIPAETPATAVMTPQQRRLAGYALLITIAAFVVQALLGIKWPLFDRLQATTIYSAVTGTGLLALLIVQWRLPYFRCRHAARKSS